MVGLEHVVGAALVVAKPMGLPNPGLGGMAGGGAAEKPQEQPASFSQPEGDV